MSLILYRLSKKATMQSNKFTSKECKTALTSLSSVFSCGKWKSKHFYNSYSPCGVDRMLIERGTLTISRSDYVLVLALTARCNLSLCAKNGNKKSDPRYNKRTRDRERRRTYRSFTSARLLERRGQFRFVRRLMMSERNKIVVVYMTIHDPKFLRIHLNGGSWRGWLILPSFCLRLGFPPY